MLCSVCCHLWYRRIGEEHSGIGMSGKNVRRGKLHVRRDIPYGGSLSLLVSSFISYESPRRNVDTLTRRHHHQHHLVTSYATVEPEVPLSDQQVSSLSEHRNPSYSPIICSQRTTSCPAMINFPFDPFDPFYNVEVGDTSSAGSMSRELLG
jgi:hypothetical protein